MIDSKIRPIINVAYVIIAFGCIDLVVTFLPFSNGVEKHDDVLVFGIIIALIHFVIGFSVIRRTKYGFIALKYYLQLFKLCIPIGTYIAYKLLKYIKDNDIDQYYGQ